LSHALVTSTFSVTAVDDVLRGRYPFNVPGHSFFFRAPPRPLRIWACPRNVGRPSSRFVPCSPCWGCPLTTFAGLTFSSLSFCFMASFRDFWRFIFHLNEGPQPKRPFTGLLRFGGWSYSCRDPPLGHQRRHPTSSLPLAVFLVKTPR